MKTAYLKIVLIVLMAVSATIIAVTTIATTVLADDGFEACYDADGYKYWHNVDSDKYYYADANGNVACDQNGPIEMTGKSTKKSSSLDKSLAGETRYANVSDFLALRTGPSVDSAMIAKLAPNAQVTIIGTTGNWVKVYAPSVDSDGYVSASYLSKTKTASENKSSSSSSSYKKVFGTKNYLALRTATAYDDANEIAKLYNGEEVKVYDRNVNGSGYALVYAPSVGMTGYVNNNYLR